MGESRLNNTMLSSSRSTRTRKNIKPSNVSNDALMQNFGGGNGMNDDDDEDDEDYNMNEDKNYLDEDDQEDDEHYDKITTPITEMDVDTSERKKKKKKRKKSGDDDMMIASDQDEDMK